MGDAESLPEPPQSSSDDVLEMKRDLERLIEDTENLSGVLTLLCLIALSHGVRKTSVNIFAFEDSGLAWSCVNTDIIPLCPPVVQLTWMCYDMTALKTSPELWDSMQKLEEAHHKCRAVVCGDQEQEPEMGTCPELAVIATTQM
ncbi:hypothetical protein ABVT39_001283 [Epinephelus coioides]